jgi:hypothetical protein
MCWHVARVIYYSCLLHHWDAPAKVAAPLVALLGEMLHLQHHLMRTLIIAVREIVKTFRVQVLLISLRTHIIMLLFNHVFMGRITSKHQKHRSSSLTSTSSSSGCRTR